MSQYIPMGPAAKVPPFDRRITQEEYDTVLSWLYFFGLDDGFVQGPEAASLEYVPEFNGEGIMTCKTHPCGCVFLYLTSFPQADRGSR
jgi:putative pyruvate formate lyase activating enzyme